MFITGLDPSPTTEGGTLGAVLVLRRILAEKAGVLTRYTSVHLSESPAGAPLVDLRATVVFAKDDWVDRYKFEALIFAGPAQLFAGTKVKHGNAILKVRSSDVTRPFVSSTSLICLCRLERKVRVSTRVASACHRRYYE
jgi:hypothetical protein